MEVLTTKFITMNKNIYEIFKCQVFCTKLNLDLSLLKKYCFQLQKNNALQKYELLLKNQPEYIQQIPLQYLASYLGITQRHLSRIRKEISF